MPTGAQWRKYPNWAHLNFSKNDPVAILSGPYDRQAALNGKAWVKCPIANRQHS